MSTTFMSLPQEIREKILMAALSVENNIVYIDDEDAEDYEVRRIHRISKLVFFNGMRDFSTHEDRYWEHNTRRHKGHERQLLRQPRFHKDWRILPFDNYVFFDSKADFDQSESRVVARLQNRAARKRARERGEMTRQKIYAIVYAEGGIFCEEWSNLPVHDFIAFDSPLELLENDRNWHVSRCKRGRITEQIEYAIKYARGGSFCKEWKILPVHSFIAFDSPLELLEHDNRRHSRSRRQEEAEDPRSHQDQEQLSDSDDDEDVHPLIREPAQTCRPDRVLLPLLLANRQISTEASNAFHRENTFVRVNVYVYSDSASLSLLSFMLDVLPMLTLQLGNRAQPDVALIIDLYQFPDGLERNEHPGGHRPWHMFIESRYLPLLVDCINTFPSKCGYEKLLPELHANGVFFQTWFGHIPVYQIGLEFNPNPSHSKEYTDKRTSQLINGLKGFRCLGHMDGDGEVWKRGIKIDGLDDDQQAEFLSAYNLPPFPPEEDETIKEQRMTYEALWSRYFDQYAEDTH
ncbi:hypothetical protein HYFRA_00002870 [Hymenoscyphus fraxineus]|uniref:Uncharacterized protein n=1 Tax=Hymenoscyphus fraxineus TaxID=746836 RepID=A0A9N9PP42_9HELO|nr:hypothetical protein HYFRA_00002870 [Hymenoscyphus fraxineus]